MKKVRGLILITFMLIFLCSSVFAIDHVVSNSEDWRDVYSTMIYANLLSKASNFLVSEKHAPLLLNSISKNSVIQVISSKKVPYIFNYKNIIEARGFPEPEELEFDNVNLELAKMLTDINSFIIIDDSYGYNSISVAPYAILTKSYVLFVDNNNINSVMSFLADKNLENIIIYGHVDRQVKDALAIYNPKIINLEDRFDNNIEIVKEYRKIDPANQVVFSNGEFIEQEVMSGKEPVIFIGKQNVPDQIKDYIKSTDISVGVLVGNDLVGTATNIRRELGVNTFVKFAQGARAPGGAISSVEGLDLFYIPTYSLNLEIYSIKYNQATDRLEVTYRNNAEVATYFKGTITLRSNTGEEKKIGDIEPIFIDSKSIKTVVYTDIGLVGESFKADVFTLYGESKKSLEFALQGTLDVEIVNILDDCEISIEDLYYYTTRDYFLVKVKNIGPVDCYVDIELVDVLIADEKNTLGLEDVAFLPKGDTKGLPIKAELLDYDIERNEYIDVIAYYGQREDSLVKLLKGRFKLILKKFDIIYYVAIFIIILILLLILLAFLTRKKCPACDYRNPRYLKNCRMCGSRLD